MPDVISLPQLLDQSLGTPEIGAVNFNHLHKLLHEIINRLDIANQQVPVSDINTKRDAKSFAASFPKASYTALSDKVQKIEQDLGHMSSSLPGAKDMIENVKSDTPLTDLWQYMKLSNRMDVNETGIQTVSFQFCFTIWINLGLLAPTTTAQVPCKL